MPLIDWSPDYCLGESTIDRQHESLVELLNTMHEAYSCGSPRPVLQRVMSDLSSYIAYHFRCESEIMRAAGYPEIARHEREHRALIEQVDTLEIRLAKGLDQHGGAWMAGVRDWLMDHICGEDRRFGVYLKTHAAEESTTVVR